MGDERPDELDRLDNIADAIASFQDLFDAEEPLDVVLLSIAELAAKAIPDADTVSITVVEDTGPRTAASTDDQSAVLDKVQYDHQRGPCLEAAEAQRSVRVAVNAVEHTYPEFAAAAGEWGVNAALCVPLLLEQAAREPELVGSLNIYSTSVTAFDPFDESLTRLYTVTAGHAITNARRSLALRREVDQLFRALASRSDIDQAKGALRAVHGYSEDEAFRQLATESQHRNIKLNTLARQFLESLTEGKSAP